MALKGSTGSVLGYACGAFAKKVSQVLIWWGGLAFSFLGWLAWCQYISINWRKIDADVFNLVAKANDPKTGFVDKTKKLITHHLPLWGGFMAAFKYAF